MKTIFFNVRFTLLSTFCLFAMMGMSQTYEVEKTAGGSWAIYMGSNGANTLIDGGHNCTTGLSNTVVGSDAGMAVTTGSENTFVGKLAGFENSGSENTMIGAAAGSSYPNSGSRNVFIGHRAGGFETGSDQLYISNDDKAASLIRGDFATEELKVNGDLTIRDVLQLTSTTVDPGCTVAADAGKFWLDPTGTWKLKICYGPNGWKTIDTL